MVRKRYSEEDILRLLREIEVHLNGGLDVVGCKVRLLVGPFAY